MKLGILFLIFLFVLILLYISGCNRTGRWLVKDDELLHADAMVLLMGSFPERVMQAVDLYNDGRSNKLIIVHEGMGPYKLLESRGADVISTTEQVHNSAVALGIPADSITVLLGDARSTMNEAVIISSYLASRPEIDTIILVSSPTHMRRASMIFRAAFKTKGISVYIGCSPSRYSDFMPERWWRRKEDVQSVLSEFVKMGSFILFEKKELRRQE